MAVPFVTHPSELRDEADGPVEAHHGAPSRHVAEHTRGQAPIGDRRSERAGERGRAGRGRDEGSESGQPIVFWKPPCHRAPPLDQRDAHRVSRTQAGPLEHLPRGALPGEVDPYDRLAGGAGRREAVDNTKLPRRDVAHVHDLDGDGDGVEPHGRRQQRTDLIRVGKAGRIRERSVDHDPGVVDRGAAAVVLRDVHRQWAIERLTRRTPTRQD